MSLSWRAGPPVVGVRVLSGRSYDRSGPTLGRTASRSDGGQLIAAIANQSRDAASKAPIGNLDAVIYSASFNRTAAFSDIVEQVYGTTPSGDIKNNRLWDTQADGFVTPDAVPGYPTTPGYALTTGSGTPKAAGYISQLTAAP